MLTMSANENILESVFGLSVFVFYELSGNIESRKKVLITDGDPSCKTSEIHCNVCIFQGRRQQRPGPVIHVISGGGSFRGWKWGICVCVCAQLCLTLCEPMNCSPQVSSVHGILQARMLEWIAFSFSRGSSQPKDQTWVFCVSFAGHWQVGSLPLHHLGSPLGNGAQWGKADKNGPGRPQAPTRGEGSSLAKTQDFHRTFLFSLCISSSQWMAPGLGGQSMGLLEAEW